MRKPEYPIVEKCYDLVLWLHGRTAAFPRTRKAGIGVRLENKVLDLFESLGAATTTKKRLGLLEEASDQLDGLRRLRLCPARFGG
ncbi:MAG: four helix bundle protein [Planctomycetes bacterium]|nr:four helix bundle protein [Planctomycetota bacterium]